MSLGVLLLTVGLVMCLDFALRSHDVRTLYAGVIGLAMGGTEISRSVAPSIARYLPWVAVAAAVAYLAHRLIA